jgi:hypothetical protein
MVLIKRNSKSGEQHPRYLSVEFQLFDMIANGYMGDVMNLGNNNFSVIGTCNRGKTARAKSRANISMTWHTESSISVVPK